VGRNSPEGAPVNGQQTTDNRRTLWPIQSDGWFTRLGVLTFQPAAFVVIDIYALCWALLSRESLNWHGGATLATWLMTLFIQRAEHRDTQAIQAKLDELLQAQHRARNDLMRIDEREPEEIEHHRERTHEHG
jgi:low affinity Fe/Cu permease